MLIPSIDIVDGQAVQLLAGERQMINAGDPLPLLERLARAGEVAVIDIDAARGEGDNSKLIREMCKRAKIRVGGGIRDSEVARSWLDAGAHRIIIGTAATPELLSKLPRGRTMAAVDSRDGRVLSHGWRQDTGERLLDRIREIAPMCGGLLVTFVEKEGRARGTDLARAGEVIAAADGAVVTIAGGITTPQEIGLIDQMGGQSQVGMALYNGMLSLGEALTAPMHSDRSDGLWPTVVVDESGVALGLAYSDLASVEAALESGRGVYRSRSRGLWDKGAMSGATQRLIGIDLDCDRDSLRFTVRQDGTGFCHRNTRSCWGDDFGIPRLMRRLEELASTMGPAGSNTRKLLESPALLSSKLVEEACELADATATTEVVHEAADLIYFALVKSASVGVGLEAISAELDMRELRVTRRPMEQSAP